MRWRGLLFILLWIFFSVFLIYLLVLQPYIADEANPILLFSSTSSWSFPFSTTIKDSVEHSETPMFSWFTCPLNSMTFISSNPSFTNSSSLPFSIPFRMSFLEKKKKILKIAHITDFHLDPYYDPTASPTTQCHSSSSSSSSSSSFSSSSPSIFQWFHTSNEEQNETKEELKCKGTWVYHFVLNKLMNWTWWKQGVFSYFSNAKRKKHKPPSPSPSNWPWYGQVGSSCDSPPRLIALVAQFLSTHEIDVVFWTGDSARHDRDPKLPRTRDEVLHQNTLSSQWLCWSQHHHLWRFNTSFVIFPTLGNLDVYPHNLLGGPSLLPWLNDFVNSLTSILPFSLPFPNTSTSTNTTTSSSGISSTSSSTNPTTPDFNTYLMDFKLFGSYMYPLIPEQLYILSLNTILFSKDNTWSTPCNESGPSMDLVQWLIQKLNQLPNPSSSSSSSPFQAKVIVLGHIPPLPTTWMPSCLNEMIQLWQTYSFRLLSWHAGHTNEDTFLFFNSSFQFSSPLHSNGSSMYFQNQSQPLAPIYIAPSVIPVHNPGIRLMELNLDPLEWMQWDQYYLPLEKTNDHNDKDPLDSVRFDTGSPLSFFLEPLNATLKESLLPNQHESGPKENEMKKRIGHSKLPKFQLEYSTLKDYGLTNLSLLNWKQVLSEVGFLDKYKYFMNVKGVYPNDKEKNKEKEKKK